MANHGGVTKSSDDGGNWSRMSIGLGVTDAFRMSTSYTNPEYILIGTYHNGSQITQGQYSNGWTPDWRHETDGDGTDCVIDPSDPKYMWTSAQYWPPFSPMFRSTNEGQIFSSNGTSAGWSSTLEMNQNGILVFNRTTSNSPQQRDVFISEDKGDNFVRISDFSAPQLIGNVPYFVYKIALTSNPNIIYVEVNESLENDLYFWEGGEETHLFRTTNALDSPGNIIWEELDKPRSERCADIYADYDNPYILYMTYGSSTVNSIAQNGSKMLYKVNYDGSTIDCNNPSDPNCQDLTFNLPNTNVGTYGFTLEKGTDGGMYMSTKFGVYYTDNKLINSGDYWVEFGTDLPNTGSSGIEINYEINKMRIATKGRGIWEHDLMCPDCVDNTFTSPHQQDEFFECQNDIISSTSIGVGNNITYRAGNSVNLLPGFSTTNSTYFRAFIHACDKPGNSFKNNDTSELNRSENNDNHNKVSESRLLVYPNPTSDYVSIEVSHNKKVLPIKIYSFDGKLVYSSLIKPKQTKLIDIQNMSNGLYLIRVESDDKILNTKFIKQ
jgi:hypothetical protein